MNALVKTGTVKWYDKVKGFGFIEPEEGGNDVFVHRTALEDARIAEIREGQRLEYSEAIDRGKRKAANLKIV